ncbi:MAG: group 1 family glycosyl transferase, partial [Planctomycetota bacterium]|nr:group 1 family glycosyl transferase [Planctomycetota bacterium]
VIAYKAGGVLETIVDGVTGIFFKEQSVSALCTAVEQLEKDVGNFDPDAIREHALKWDTSIFKERFRKFVEEKWKEWKSKNA